MLRPPPSCPPSVLCSLREDSLAWQVACWSAYEEMKEQRSSGRLAAFTDRELPYSGSDGPRRDGD